LNTFTEFAKAHSRTERREHRKPFVSVVVPAYNESAIIGESLDRLYSYMESLEDAYAWELVVVDDGSSDGTGELADGFAREHENVRVLHHVCNLRLGQALRTAFANCSGDYIVTMDADLSYSPEHIGRLLATIRDTKSDIVIASPYMKGGKVTNVPWLRRKLSEWANRFLAFACRENLKTLTGMVRAYDAQFLAGLDLKGVNVDIHSEIIYKAMILRARVVEIPAHLDWGPLKGKERRSSMKIGSGITLNLLSGFMFRPFIFFIIPGFTLTLLAVYPLIWSLIHTIRFLAAAPGSMPSFGIRFSFAIAEAFKRSPHSFIVGGFTLMVAIQMISLGIIALQNHRHFKDLYHLMSCLYRTRRTSR
jgi:glycosyltransferase involved in cell wall biosynthesis